MAARHDKALSGAGNVTGMEGGDGRTFLNRSFTRARLISAVRNDPPLML